MGGFFDDDFQVDDDDFESLVNRAIQNSRKAAAVENGAGVPPVTGSTAPQAGVNHSTRGPSSGVGAYGRQDPLPVVSRSSAAQQPQRGSSFSNLPSGHTGPRPPAQYSRQDAVGPRPAAEPRYPSAASRAPQSASAPQPAAQTGSQQGFAGSLTALQQQIRPVSSLQTEQHRQPPAPAPAASLAASSTVIADPLIHAQLCGTVSCQSVALSTRLQQELKDRAALQDQLNAQMGSNSLLRSQAERLERELQEQQRRGSGYTASASSRPQGRPGAGANPLAEFQLAEQAKQVETLQQQLAFHEQEAESARRANADRDERLRRAEAQQGHLHEELRKAEAAHAQLQAELEDAHRERRERALAASTSHATDSGAHSVGKGGTRVAAPAPLPRATPSKGEAGVSEAGGQGASVAAHEQLRGGSTLSTGLSESSAATCAWQRLWAECSHSLPILLAGPAEAHMPKDDADRGPAAAQAALSPTAALHHMGEQSSGPRLTHLLFRDLQPVPEAQGGILAPPQNAQGLLRPLVRWLLGHGPPHKGPRLTDQLAALLYLAVQNCSGSGGHCGLLSPRQRHLGKAGRSLREARQQSQWLRCAQEVLVLLRALAADASLGEACLRDLAASPPTLRRLLVTLARLTQWRCPAQDRSWIEGDSAIAPALMAPWAAAYVVSGGSASVPCSASSGDHEIDAGALVSWPRIALLASSLHQRIVHYIGRAAVT
ncbi:hypothetical protein WJX73_007291 [Symbiochloris irregularis]|uniref:Uncharacterized protein n=1 Tax=Symbiochloris irregularis TaxID=706552 RepID=A0AAW1NWF1_9CHLO